MANRKFVKTIIIFLFIIFFIFLLKKWMRNSKQNASGVGKFKKSVNSIRYWKKRLNPDNQLDITFIECSNGVRILDECDMLGNGIITLYRPGKGKGCYSLVRQRADIYDRNTLQILETGKCVRHSKGMKNDFSDEYMMTIPTFQKNFNLNSTISLLRKNRIIS